MGRIKSKQRKTKERKVREKASTTLKVQKGKFIDKHWGKFRKETEKNGDNINAAYKKLFIDPRRRAKDIKSLKKVKTGLPKELKAHVGSFLAPKRGTAASEANVLKRKKRERRRKHK